MNKRTRTEIIRTPSASAEHPGSDCERACRSILGVVEFLEARISEKEASVRRRYGNRTLGGVQEPDELRPVGQMILAECAMKRAIIAEWRSAAAADGTAHLCEADGPSVVAMRSMLRILAAGYESHPGYRTEWFDRH